jgi:hypothetical protein
VELQRRSPSTSPAHKRRRSRPPATRRASRVPEQRGHDQRGESQFAPPTPSSPPQVRPWVSRSLPSSASSDGSPNKRIVRRRYHHHKFRHLHHRSVSHSLSLQVQELRAQCAWVPAMSPVWRGGSNGPEKICLRPTLRESVRWNEQPTGCNNARSKSIKLYDKTIFKRRLELLLVRKT